MSSPTSVEKELVVRKTIFTLFGVPWKWTSKSWQFIPSRIAFCEATALLFLQNETIGTRILYGFVFALLLLDSQFLHIVGHTLGGKFVGAPMDENLIVANKIWTRYDDNSLDLPKRVHLGRALGGPLFSLCVGLIALVAWWFLGGYALLFFTAANLFLGIGLLFPFPTVDGEIIWRELKRR